MKSFGECLKAFRRGVYVAGGGYNGLVICANGAHLGIAFDEAVRTLEASSLTVNNVEYGARKIYCERGGTLWFRTAEMDLDRILQGYEWPHIIALCALGNKTEDVLLAFNRTTNDKITPQFDHASL